MNFKDFNIREYHEVSGTLRGSQGVPIAFQGGTWRSQVRFWGSQGLRRFQEVGGELLGVSRALLGISGAFQGSHWAFQWDPGGFQ